MPQRVQEALGELAGAAKEGLLALSVGVGLGVLSELMAEEVDDVVGPKGRHDAERTAVRHGSEAGSVTLGGRRVPVDRPRVRATDGTGEVTMSTYAHLRVAWRRTSPQAESTFLPGVPLRSRGTARRESSCGYYRSLLLTMSASLTDHVLAGPTVRFGATLTADQVDQQLMAMEALPETVVFDLSAVTFADTVGLLYLVAVLSSLHRKGIRFALELPAKQQVRDHMRRCRFGATLGERVGTPATELLTTGSRRHKGERAEHYLPSRQGRPSGKLVELDVMRDVGMAAAHRRIDQWDEPEIRSFLDRRLGGRWNLVAPGLVYEALANAVRHPKATAVTSAAHVDDKARPHGMLSVGFWDDGESIVSTLRAVLDDGGKRLRNERFDLYYDWYGVYGAEDHADRKQFRGTVFSGDPVPSRDAGTPSDADLLVAATFPGVTSDPHAERPPSAAAGLGPKFDRPGMGLYILTTLAIDSFGGSVLLRTGAVSANFRRAKPAEQKEHGFRYRVGVVDHPSLERHFSGNYVVIRLPLLG